MTGSCRFTDRLGRQWKLHLDYTLGEDVRKETGVNLAVTSRSLEWVEALFGEPGRLVSICWILCEEQAKALNLTPEEFGRGFDGPTLEAAGVSLAHAIAGFFPRSAIAQAIQEGLDKMLNKADRVGVEKIRQMIETDFNSVETSPGFAESIPTG